MRNHEELEVWQKAHELTLQIYRATECFPKSEIFGLRSQIRRALGSIGANLAEGCGRWNDGDLGRYIQIAMGSASELQNHLRLARDLGFIEKSTCANLFSDLSSVRQMLTAFLKRVRGARVGTRSGADSSGE